jgi:hypothetical protein
MSNEENDEPMGNGQESLRTWQITFDVMSWLAVSMLTYVMMRARLPI